MIASLIEVVNSGDEEIIAAFAPSAVLGNSTDSGESRNMSIIAPLKCKHFLWRCLIDSPSEKFALKVSFLVDNSCHLVLICPVIRMVLSWIDKFK